MRRLSANRTELKRVRFDKNLEFDARVCSELGSCLAEKTPDHRATQPVLAAPSISGLTHLYLELILQLTRPRLDLTRAFFELL
jgi:hypothetical protein